MQTLCVCVYTVFRSVCTDINNFVVAFCVLCLPYGAKGWSLVCDCGISWSYSHALLNKFQSQLRLLCLVGQNILTTSPWDPFLPASL